MFALAIRARRAATQRIASNDREAQRAARIAAHVKARFPQVYELVAERVDAGTDEHIAALEEELDGTR